MSIREERVWAGSSTSHKTALEAEAGYVAKMAADNGNDTEDDDTPRLLSVDQGIATITIHGSLVNSDSPYLKYYGVCGYPEIRSALLAAANDPEVKQILLDIDSGGGAVSGCDDTGKLIRMISSKIKPVTTYADTMCSAAYWLGSSASKVYAAKASLVGSIGIISTFVEHSEANKMEGLGVTVIRAGKHKALANPNEKLTAEARAQIQKLVDSAYTVFVEHVAEMRGVTYAKADVEMADGQEFIGQAAVDVGLLDGLTTYDALITKLRAKIVASEQKSIDNQRNGSNRLYGSTTSDPVKAENDPSASTRTTSPGDSQMGKKALTAADIAALAAGATGVSVEAADSAAEAAHSAAVDQPVIEGAVDGVQAEAGKPEAEKVVASAESAVAEQVAIVDATVQLLNSQLKEKDASLLEAGIKLNELQGKLAEAEASQVPLLQIAGKSIANMQVALGGSAVSVEGMSAAAVLAEHDRVSEVFKTKFKVGGVAAVSAETPVDKPTQVDPRHIARVNAVRFQK